MNDCFGTDSFGNKYKKKVCCSENKKHEKKGKLVQFKYVTAKSIIPIDQDNLPEDVPLNPFNPTPIATLTLREVKGDNVVWLNGIYHINNDSPTPSDVITSIYRGSIADTNLIYRSIIEIEHAPIGPDTGDDATQVVVQHVDPHKSTEEANVTYILTAQVGPDTQGADLFVIGPITFTATEINS